MSTAESPAQPYEPEEGRFDELTSHDGPIRDRWQQLVWSFQHLDPGELDTRRRMADRLVVAEGASHVLHGEDTDTSRPWQVDPMPILVSGAEWTELERGLVQRARLLDALLDDLYGPRRMLSAGVLPAEVVLAGGRYLRAVHGVVPAGGRRLAVYGADVVRDASGRFLVLRDLTDAPAGAGYALLNRRVLTRLFPDVHRNLRVHRLGRFFAGLRAALTALAPGDRPSPRTVVLTPGMGHESYFEHSYLATYLGYHLVEGQDLTMRDGRLWLRALGGLEAVDVVLRRVADAGSDPLEMPGRPGGVPGLLQAAREGGVGLANALGSGAAEHPALLAYLPALCERLLGEPLRLASVPTLWCGDPDHRSHVVANLDRMVLHDTDPTAAEPSVFGSRLSDADVAGWTTRIARDPYRYVAQELVEFATTPVLRDGGLAPGSAVLRLQAAATPEGFLAMAGGLGRVVEPGLPVLRQASGWSKDVWVLADDPAQHLRLWWAPEPQIPQVDLRASLPSRSAEALYWVGRNAERAEAGTRLARVLLQRFGQSPELATTDEGRWLTTALGALRAVSGGAGSPAPPLPGEAGALVRAELADATSERAGAIVDSLRHLATTAASVREYLSTSTWRLLGQLDTLRLSLPGDVAKADLYVATETFDNVLLALAGFAGLTAESTVRGPSWRFLDLGRRTERALQLCNLLEATLVDVHPPATGQPLAELVLAAVESLVAYRRRYRSDVEIEAVCDLLLGDVTNPRSLAFQLDAMAQDLLTLPERDERTTQERQVLAAQRLVYDVSWAELGHAVRGRHPGLAQLLLDTRGALLAFADHVAATWFAHADEAHPIRRGRP